MELEVVREIIHFIVPWWLGLLLLLLLLMLVQGYDLHLFNGFVKLLLILAEMMVVLCQLLLLLRGERGKELGIVRQRLIFRIILIRNPNNKVLNILLQGIRTLD